MGDVTRFQEMVTSQLGHMWVGFDAGRRANFPGPPREAADSFVRSLGYFPIGDQWIDLDEEELDPVAQLIARLRHDLAYPSAELLSAADAAACAKAFYELFDAGQSTRLTNWLNNGWSPITGSTFDAAYVAMDDAQIGLFLIQAED